MLKIQFCIAGINYILKMHSNRQHKNIYIFFLHSERKILQNSSKSQYLSHCTFELNTSSIFNELIVWTKQTVQKTSLYNYNCALSLSEHSPWTPRRYSQSSPQVSRPVSSNLQNPLPDIGLDIAQWPNSTTQIAFSTGFFFPRAGPE